MNIKKLLNPSVNWTIISIGLVLSIGVRAQDESLAGSFFSGKQVTIFFYSYLVSLYNNRLLIPNKITIINSLIHSRMCVALFNRPRYNIHGTGFHLHITTFVTVRL